jgi:hypothetical protein
MRPPPADIAEDTQTPYFLTDLDHGGIERASARWADRAAWDVRSAILASPHEKNPSTNLRETSTAAFTITRPQTGCLHPHP